MTAFVDPESDLVKAVLTDKAVRLVATGLERLLDDAEAGGLSREEGLAVIDRTIEELRARDEQDEIFQRLHEAIEEEIARQKGR